MSASEVTLALSCENPAAQLFVLDGEFTVVGRGASPLAVTLAPGVYALRARVGDAASEQVEILHGRDQPYAITLKAPLFESPLPLDGTSTTHEYQSYPLQRFTGKDPAAVTQIGAGAAVVFCLRDSSRMNFNLPPDQRAAYHANFAGFRLLSADDAVLVNFDEAAEKHIDQGFVAAHVRLDPGAYALACEREGAYTCLPLYVPAGWALQIYLQLEPVRDGAVEMRPDFNDTSCIFDRLADQFSPARADLMAIESVRLALQARRNIDDASAMLGMLTQRFGNPILGLYAAHILLREDKPDFDLLERVIGNTAELLGDGYPDVVALAFEFERRAHKRPANAGQRPWSELLEQLAGPPLLSRSWDLLVACASSAAAGKFDRLRVFRVASNLVSAGIYLAWRRSVVAQPSQLEMEQVSLPEPAAQKGFAELARSAGSITKKFLFGLAARLPESVQVELGTARVGDITTLSEAAAAFRLVARKYPWEKIVPALRRNETYTASLTPFQRDLIIALRFAAADRDTLPACNERFIQDLLQAQRVPLETLASALRGLDLILGILKIGSLLLNSATPKSGAPAPSN